MSAGSLSGARPLKTQQPEFDGVHGNLDAWPQTLIILARAPLTGNMALGLPHGKTQGSSTTIAGPEPTLATLVTRFAKLTGRRPSHVARFTLPPRVAHATDIAVTHVRRTALPRIASIAIIASVTDTGASETLSDAGLQLSVAMRRKEELCGHPAGIVLRPTGLGARIGVRALGSKSRHRQDSERRSPGKFQRFQCSLKHVPPPKSPGRAGRLSLGKRRKLVPEP